MIDAEELEVSKANADAALSSENPQIRWLLGVDAHGDDLSLFRIGPTASSNMSQLRRRF
jgi:hypothetical protein